MIPLYVLDLGRQHRAHIAQSRRRRVVQRHRLEVAAVVTLVLTVAAAAVSGGIRW